MAESERMIASEPPMNIQSILGAVAWCAITFGAAALSARSMPDEWYRELHKPSWTPPGWVFGPVWSIVYLMMAAAAWLVWRKAGISTALALFLVQLALNALWSYLFFGVQRPDLAFIDILALWAMILATIISFWKVSPLSGALLIPYIVWVSFASALNGTIWAMNR